MPTNPVTHSYAGSPAETQAKSTPPKYGGGIDGMFMQLLVAQLQNQDPMSPMDPSTFVNQLVGVSTLDQVSQINQLLQISWSTVDDARAASSTHTSGGQ